VSGKNLSGARTQTLNVRQVPRIIRHQVKKDGDSTPVSISGTDPWLNWDSQLDNPTDSEENCLADNEYDIEQKTGIEVPESQKKKDLSAAPNEPRLVRPTGRSKRQAEKVLGTVYAVGARRNNEGKKT